MNKQITIFPLFFLIISTTFQYGYFSLPGLTAVLISFVFLMLLFFRNKFTANILQKQSETLPLIFIIIYTLFIFFSGGIYQERTTASFALLLIPLALFPLVLTFAVKLPDTVSLLKNRFKILLFFALFLRFLIIMASPSPRIDTFVILKEAPQAFLSGRNPYETVYSKIYQNVEPNYYSYWPASFLLEVPFVTFFSDPRILFIIADIGAALLLYHLGKRTKEAQLYSLIYLFRPNSNFIIEQSWLTPLAFFLVALSLLLSIKKRYSFSGIIWGLLVGLKPDYLLAVPFLWFLTHGNRKAILLFLFTVGVVVLPFLFTRPNEFINQTILLYLLPGEKIPIPIHLSLNLNTLFYHIFGRDLPFLLPGAVFAIFFTGVLYHLKLNNTGKTVILGMTVTFFCFYLLFRQAFINYYYFVTGLLILWLVYKTANHQR